MVYVCEIRRHKDDIEIVFGYTEKHYIQSPQPGDVCMTDMIHVYYAYNTFNKKEYKDIRFDPEDKNSRWVVYKKNVYNDFDQAKSSFFRQLFSK